MVRLTREVRFAINSAADEQLSRRPANSYGGYPSLTGLGHYFVMALTLEGEIDWATGYLLNIKKVDSVVRERCIPMFENEIRAGRFGGGGGMVGSAFELLKDSFAPVRLVSLRLGLSPFLSLQLNALELPMIQLSQRFEFSACHRLFNPAFTDEQNLAVFGKCSNPHGHGHNYELQVTLTGKPDENGTLIDIPAFERVVAETVVERFDHKNLNIELPEFRTLIPTVENIAAVIYKLLRPRFEGGRGRLASVTVWETPKTWCEYSEG